MNSNLKFLFFLLLVSITTTSQNATFNWAIGGGGATGPDRPADIATDKDGNIFTACTFTNNATFNGITVTGSEKPAGATNYSPNLFISKISSEKTTLWKIYSNEGIIEPTAITTTNAGDLIVTGNMYAINLASTSNASLIDAGGNKTTFTGLYKYSSDCQAFVAKFNSNGILQWAKEINSGKLKLKDGVSTNAVAADASGNIYITGNFATCLMLPGSTDSITSTNTTDASFIAKFNGETGDVVWKKTSSGGIVSETLNALAYGDDGYLYATGVLRNVATPIPVTYSNKTYTPSKGYDLTLFKFDTDGNFVYIQNREYAGETRVKDIIVKNGIAYISATLYGNNTGMTFNDGNFVTTISTFNGILAAFNALDGTDKWHKAILAPGISDQLYLNYGIDNRLYAFGYHSNKKSSSPAADVNFGNGFLLSPLSYVSGYDAFIASFDANSGTTKEVHLVASGTGSEMSFGLASYGKYLYLLGQLNSAPSTFEDASTVNTAGGFDFYLAKYTITDSSSGLNSIRDSEYAFYNSLEKRVTIQNAEQFSSIYLCDITGKVVTIIDNQTERVEINTEKLCKGIYIIKLKSKKGLLISQRLLVN